MQGGVYNYSPLVLKLTFLQIGAHHLLMSGILLDVVFLMSLSSLPAPYSVPELLLRTIAAISSATIFALERANFDVVIFLVIMLGTLIYLRSSVFRIVGYLIFLVAAAIKYFPITLLILILQEPVRRLLMLVGCLIFIGVMFLVYFGAGTVAAIHIIPRAGPLGNDFGAINIPLGLSLLFFPPANISVSAVANYQMPKLIVLAHFGMILYSIFLAKVAVKKYNSALHGLDFSRSVFLIIGSTVIISCFFIAQNIVYRDIFLILTLPGIFAMEKFEISQVRGELRKLVLAIFFIMWEEFFRFVFVRAVAHVVGNPLDYCLDILFWLCREFVWWWTVIQLMSFVVWYIEAAIRSVCGFRPTVLRPLTGRHKELTT